MSRPPGPTYKCKFLPRLYTRYNTKKAKYCKKIINNIYFYDHSVSINNYNNYQFESHSYNSGEFYQKTFEMSPRVSALSTAQLPANPEQLQQQISLATCNLGDSSDTKITDAVCKKPLEDGLSQVGERIKITAMRDLTKKPLNKLNNLDVDYLILNSPPDQLCALSKCLKLGLKRENKNWKKKFNEHHVKLSSNMATTPKMIFAAVENNSVNSCGTSTPFCEKTPCKRNWELSPIKLSYKKDQNLLNNSLELMTGKSDISVCPDSIIKSISELILVKDEDDCDLGLQENESNFDKRNSLNLNFDNSINEYEFKSPSCAEELQVIVTRESNNSVDIFKSVSSISMDKTEPCKSESNLLESSSDTIPLAHFRCSQQNYDISQSTFIDKANVKCDKTSISTNIDSCDSHSIKSCSRFDGSDDSLNVSFGNNYDTVNCDNKSDQFHGIQNDSHVLEYHKRIIPGKKWKRSLLATGGKNRATIASGVESKFSAASGRNIRFSLNPLSKSGDNGCSVKQSSRCTDIRGITKLLKINEQSSLEVTLKVDDLCNSSLDGIDDINIKKINYDERDDYEEPQIGEFDFTLLIHQQVADILHKDDLNKTLLSVSPSSDDHKRYAKENVLNLCGHVSPINFSEAYPEYFFKNCEKIGEGIFGEVFCYFSPCSQQKTVFKVIPIEGNRLVNFSPQKTYSEVFSEMCIAISLSRLKNRVNGNCTDGFCSLLKMTCLKGKYPTKLITLWNQYDKTRCSENDSPIMFDSEQLYIALEMLDGGEPLESYKFSSSRQSYSILLQVIHSLAVAEKAFEFEHRDLHWGNILVSKTNKKKIKFVIDKITYSVSSYGKKSTIIDYTLSRIRTGNFDIYNDLSKDSGLFEAYGDYQFDVYRSMRDDVNNNWHMYVPKTNVRWVHYLASKCLKGVYYKANHNIHKLYLMKIKCLRDSILKYSSAAEIVKKLDKI